MKTLRIAAVVCIFIGSGTTALAQFYPGVKDIFPADERLKVWRPAGPLKLAQPVRVHLEIEGADVAIVGVDQYSKKRWLHNRSQGVDVGSAEVKIVEDNGPEKTIELVPLQLGSVTFDIHVFFKDGGHAQKRITVRVVPCSKGLKRFTVAGVHGAMLLILGADEMDRSKWLTPKAEYYMLDHSIRLRNLDEMKFTVEQPESSPIIRVDPNGMVHALRPGKVMLAGDFDGVIDKIPVEVCTLENAPATQRRLIERRQRGRKSF